MSEEAQAEKKTADVPKRRVGFEVVVPTTGRAEWDASLKQTFTAILPPDAPLLMCNRPVFNALVEEVGVPQASLGQYRYWAFNVVPSRATVTGVGEIGVPVMLFNVDSSIRLRYINRLQKECVATFSYETENLACDSDLAPPPSKSPLSLSLAPTVSPPTSTPTPTSTPMTTPMTTPTLTSISTPPKTPSTSTSSEPSSPTPRLVPSSAFDETSGSNVKDEKDVKLVGQKRGDHVDFETVDYDDAKMEPVMAEVGRTRRALNSLWDVRKTTAEPGEATRMSRLLWVPGPEQRSYFVPTQSSLLDNAAVAHAIATEAWEWYGPVVQQLVVCPTTFSLAILGIRRVRAVGTHQPMAYYGDRSFGLAEILIALPA